MQWTLNRHIFRVLRAVDFRHVPASLRIVLERMASHFGSSGATENAFREMKSLAAASTDGRLSNADMWQAPAMKGTLNELYRFQEVNQDEIAENLVSSAVLPENRFELQYQKQSLNFKKIVSTSATAPFTSFSPWSSNSLVEDQGLLMYLGLQGNGYDDLLQCWRTAFLLSGLVVRHKPTKRLFYSVGAYQTAAMLWPVHIRSVKGHKFVVFEALGDASRLTMMPVLAFADWEVVCAIMYALISAPSNEPTTPTDVGDPIPSPAGVRESTISSKRKSCFNPFGPPGNRKLPRFPEPSKSMRMIAHRHRSTPAPSPAPCVCT